MKKPIFTWLISIALPLCGIAQSVDIYPLNWWAGMKTRDIQLLVRSTEGGFTADTAIINYPGLKLKKCHSFANKRYLALDLELAPEIKPGTVAIQLQRNDQKLTLKWMIKEKRRGNGTSYAQGVTSADFIDLLMVDRFSNGDPSNDRVKGMKDQTLDRQKMYDRHGGDFQGVIDHLDYLQNLGVTALWFTPVMENDMPYRTEHGYAITDHYKIDARYGGSKLYKALSDSIHARGMKLIFDAVYNHFGLYHFLEQDAPDSTWVHRWPAFTRTSYREQIHFDPYAAESDRETMTDGWFDTSMPDINHSNPFMASYLIQNCIWYIEEYGIDGIRIDTYTYNDLAFANRCNAAILNEYPQMTFFGETMVHGVLNQAYFEENNINTAFKSNLQSVVDFQSLYYGIIPALTQAPGWTEGVNRLYYTLSSDFISKDPMRKVIMLDNHDEPRFFSVVGENVDKQKIGYQWLLTCRGIPQLYYGSEVLMKGFKAPDGLVRGDFPGGFKGDIKNAFTGEGLSTDERSVQELVRKLANFRKSSSAIKTGKMMHYIPVEGLYVYFRYDDQQTVMCIMNTSAEPKEIDFSRYSERTSGFKKAVNVLDATTLDMSAKTTIPGTRMWVLELGR